jgi:hypothetical protein
MKANNFDGDGSNEGTGAEPLSRIYYTEHNCNTESPRVTEDVNQAGDVNRAGGEVSSAQQRAKKKRCGTMTLFGSHPGRKYSYHRQRCKAYNRGHCRQWKLRRVQRRISSLASQHGLSRFVTLTLNPASLPTAEDPVHYIRYCWRKMREYLKRFKGRGIKKKSGTREKSVLEGVRHELGNSFVRELDGSAIQHWYRGR